MSKDDKEKDEIPVYVAWHATHPPFGDPFIIIDDEPYICVNFQIKSWRDARKKYEESVRDINNPNIEDMAKVIADAGLSLTQLFGVNWDGTGRVPGPLKLARLQRLDRFEPDLYKGMEELFNEFYDPCRHLDREKARTITKILTKEKTKEFLELTRKIWLWKAHSEQSKVDKKYLYLFDPL